MNNILDICEISGTPVKKFEGKRKYIATGDVNDNIITSFVEVDYASKPSRANQNVEIGDVLFAKMKETVKVLVIDETNCNNIYSTGFFVMKPKKDVSSQYLYWLFNSQQFNKDKDKNSKGATQKAINREGLKKIKLSKIIELEEQNHIANILNNIQEIIDLRQKQLDDLDKLIESKFIYMFGNINNSKFDKKELQEIVNRNQKYSLKRGPFGGSLKKEDFVKCGYLIYEQRHAIHNDFNYEKYYIDKKKYNEMEMFKVVPGDLIVSCSGVTLGKIAEIPKNAKRGIINQALLKISLNNEIIENEFFIQQFRSKQIQNCLFSFSRGSGIPNLPSMNEVKKIKFICPNIDNQRIYVEIVKSIKEQIENIKINIEIIENLKETLMNKYFGG